METFQIIASIFSIIIGIALMIKLIKKNKDEARKDLLNDLRDNHVISNDDYITYMKKNKLF
jgi:hypothetical protein